MDNFMDKLSKRFNAGELIQANGEAEARETQRMKQQISEYEKILQDIRRLNLKTAEMSEQVSQMLASGIEQFEAYSKEHSSLELAIKNAFEENAVQSQEKEEVAWKETLSKEDAQQMLLGLTDELDKLKQEVALQAQRMQTLVASNEAISQKVSVGGDSTLTSVKREISDATYRVEASISELKHELKDELSKADDKESDDTILLLKEDVEKLAKAQTDSTKQLSEMIVNLRLYMDEVQKHIEDYVHKEDVKVYRNVQANLAEQMTNRFRDVGDQLGSLDRGVSKNKGTKALLVITFLVASASVALQVLQLLHIL